MQAKISMYEVESKSPVELIVDWYDFITVKDIGDQSVKRITVEFINLFDHEIIHNGKNHKIIHMLSKEKF